MKHSPILSSVTITDVTTDGQGVGRSSDGRVWFVPQTVPGDVVTVQIEQEKPKHGWAKLQHIEQASADRVEPPCEYFGECGGCEWQHIQRTAQTRWKGEILQQTLQRIAGMTWPSLTVLAPEHELGVRSRLRIQVGSKQSLGFFRRNSHQIIPIQQCPVALPVLQQAWSLLRTLLRTFPFPLHEVRLMGNSREQVVASFHLDKRTRASHRELKKQLTSWWRNVSSQLQPIQGIEVWSGSQIVEEWGQTLLEEGTPHALYRPSGFAQASWAGNQLLLEQVLTFWQQSQTHCILELYAGSGNLSIPLAQAGAKIWALDSNEQALHDGSLATQQHRLQHQLHFEIFDDQLHSLLLFCQNRRVQPDCVLVDPPRRGIPPRIRDEICTLTPQTILYVSCDPATLARDLVHFQKHNYTLQHLVAVDLMPQTAHIESVAVLTQT